MGAACAPPRAVNRSQWAATRNVCDILVATLAQVELAASPVDRAVVKVARIRCRPYRFESGKVCCVLTSRSVSERVTDVCRSRSVWSVW